MAGPLPILLAAGALVLFAGGKKKRRRKSAGQEPDYAPGGHGSGGSEPDPSPSLPGGMIITARPAHPEEEQTWVLGESCGSMDDKRRGIYSAYGKNGECLVFWQWGETDRAIEQYIRDQLDQMGVSQKKACARDVWEEDPFNPPHGGRWVPNPTKYEVLEQAIKRAYPQIPTETLMNSKTVKLLPPGQDAPYYVKMVWKFAESVYDRAICGYVPVT